MTQPNPFGNTPPNQALRPNAPAQPVDEFELMRRRLRQRGAVQAEGQQRDLTRQFAALGNLPSGAALRVRQQAAQDAARTQSEAQQDVNVLQAQTQRAERESAAQRQLQRELGQLSSQTQLGVAGIGAKSALDVETLRGKYTSENLATQIAATKELTQLDIASKKELLEMDFKGRMELLKVSDGTQRYMFDKTLEHQLVIAEMDHELKDKGLDLQETLTNSTVNQTKIEGDINKVATWVNMLGPLTQGGFTGQEVMEMAEALGLELPDEIWAYVERKTNQAVQVSEAVEEYRATGSMNPSFTNPPTTQPVNQFGEPATGPASGFTPAGSESGGGSNSVRNAFTNMTTGGR